MLGEEFRKLVGRTVKYTNADGSVTWGIENK